MFVLTHRYWSTLALTVFACLVSTTTYSEGLKPGEQNSCHAAGDGWVCTRIPDATSASQSKANTSGRSFGQATNNQSNGDNPFYWVPVEQLDQQTLTAEQQQRLDTGCCGAYLPPPSSDDTPPAEADTQLFSNGKLSGDPNKTMRIEGGVTITQGSRFIRADSVELDETAGTSQIDGNIEIRETGSLIIGDSGAMNRDSGEATVENAQFVLYDSRMRGAAGALHRDERNNLTLSQGQFTQCEPGHEHWLIKGSEIFLDTEKEQGTAKHLRLELGGVPVFYFPYLSFPIGDKPKSGFLYPSFSSDDIPLPYYITFAPNYDMTITPRFVGDRGLSTELEGRNLNRWFETTLGGAWMGNGEDSISENEQKAIIEDGELTIAEATEYDGADRWLLVAQQTGQGDRWQSNIDITKVSDVAYFRHIDTANLDVNRGTYLRRLGEFSYQLDNWQLGTRWEEFQNLTLSDIEPYKQKPRFSADGLYQWGDVELTLNNQWARFDHNDPSTTYIPGDRTRLDYELAWNKEWLWGFFKPALLTQGLSYQLDDQYVAATDEDNPSVFVPQATVDMGMFFERDGNLFGGDYLHTFEPRLFYFYSDYKDQSDLAGINYDSSNLTFNYAQLFRNTRFAGNDRVDDANQLSVGLTSRFIGKTSGLERLRLSLGQIYYFEDRRVTLTGGPLTEGESQIAGQISSQLTDSLRLSGDILYSSETHKTDKGSISFRYFDDQNRIVNLAYRYNRQPEALTLTGPVDRDESQLDLSIVWPLTSSISLIARGYHDFTNDRALDTIGGFEFTSCCYRVRLVARRWLDNELIELVDNQALEYDQGIFLEVQLRGLGLNIGNRLSSALGESILNYERREENLTGRR